VPITTLVWLTRQLRSGEDELEHTKTKGRQVRIKLIRPPFSLCLGLHSALLAPWNSVLAPEDLHNMIGKTAEGACLAACVAEGTQRHTKKSTNNKTTGNDKPKTNESNDKSPPDAGAAKLDQENVPNGGSLSVNVTADRSKGEADAGTPCTGGSVNSANSAAPLLSSSEPKEGTRLGGGSRRPSIGTLSASFLSGVKTFLPGDMSFGFLSSPTQKASPDTAQASKKKEEKGNATKQKPEPKSPSPAPRADVIPDDWAVVPYQVKIGDTISNIALRNGMTSAQLTRLNKLYGRDLYLGQTVFVAMPRDRAKEVCEEMESSSLETGAIKPRGLGSFGGEVFHGVTLVDKRIQAMGDLEVNPFYLIYRPTRFVNTEHTRPSGCVSLLNTYNFRADWRDIIACTPLRRKADPRVSKDGEGIVSRSSSDLGEDVVNETKASSESSDNLSDHACNVPLLLSHEPALAGMPLSLNQSELCDDEKRTILTAQTFDNILVVVWRNPSLGFNRNRYILIGFDAQNDCCSAAESIHSFVHQEQRRKLRYEAAKKQCSDSLTAGALVSGIMYQQDTDVDSSDSSEDEDPQASIDRVQQSLMNGKISPGEADQLRAEFMRRQEEAKQQKVNSLETAEENASKKKKKSGLRSRTPSPSGSRTSSPQMAPAIPPPQTRVFAPHFVGRDSSILHEDHLIAQLAAALPDRLKFYDWKVLYNFETCGASLNNLYNNVSSHNETLMLVKTRAGDCFGVFATEEWTPTRPREYYGTGESFVFKVDDSKIQVFNWTGENEFFMASSSSHLGVGGGSSGFAFCLDDFLDRGTSNPCETYGCTEALAHRQPEFKVAEVEVLGFVQSRRVSAVGAHGEPNLPHSSLFRENSLKL